MSDERRRNDKKNPKHVNNTNETFSTFGYFDSVAKVGLSCDHYRTTRSDARYFVITARGKLLLNRQKYISKL